MMRHPIRNLISRISGKNAMKTLPARWVLVVSVGLAIPLLAALAAEKSDKSGRPPEGWKTWSPRDEIRPQFQYEPQGGRDGAGSFIISHDDREGLDGCWTKAFSVGGGRHYRFHAVRRVAGVPVPRRSAVARVIWQDASGRPVAHETSRVTSFLKGFKSVAEPEYPTDKSSDADGWTEVSDTYLVPT